jgi:dipeptidyl aminopeptidase/acylaminoacyl peptidase
MQNNPRTFWIVVVGIVLLLVIASVTLVVIGGTPTLRARTLSPAANSNASTATQISVTFARPMNQESLNGKVFINPAVPFELGWIENELRILPLAPLQPDTDYTITIGPGVQDNTGAEMGGTIEWTFRTRQPRIAYIRPMGMEGFGELWWNNQDGSDPVRLSAENQRVTTFAAAPDGTAFVYAVEESLTTANLWRIDVGNPTPIQITNEQDVYFQAPHYGTTPDMVSVEVRRPSVEAPGEMGPPTLELRRPLDGSPAGVIYDGEGAFAYSARWSPDGTKIAFIDANARSIGVFNFTPDYRFYPVSNLELGQQPWSPDSNELTYTTIQLGAGGAGLSLVTRDLQSGAESMVQPTMLEGADPAWSPDGFYIAYSFAPPAVQSRGRGIWISSRDGVETILVTAEPFISNYRPLWSPDGQWLLYNRVDPIAGFNAPPAVWLIRPDGTEAHEVSNVGVGPVWVP